jgi:hypothetical protein
MYYSRYDPTIHDVYLYGPGNIGYPTGINPNSLIYAASADFASILPRARAFTGTGPIPIPPGAGVTSLPNYYNIKDSPLLVVTGDRTVSGNNHYMANKSSDSFAVSTYAKYTGTTSAYPILSLGFWNKNLSGLSYYGPWTGIYNCVPSNQITGATAYARARYFSGSPEIPGFAAGATFYEILNPDHGFMDLIGPGTTMAQPIAKKISPSTLIQELIERGKTADYSPSPLAQSVPSSFFVTIDTIDCYIWDGNDKVIPVSGINIEYAFDSTTYETRPFSFKAYFSNAGGTYTGWAGDSSSQLLYLKNNSLYFVGSVLSLDGFNNNFAFSGPVYCGDVLPLYNFLGSRLVNRNHYWYPLHQGLTLASQIDFTRLQTTINNISSKVNLLYQEWTS